MSPKTPEPFEPKTLVAKRLCEYFGDQNFVEIGKNISMSGRNVGDCLKGKIPPSYKMIEYIAENGGDVNYILTGEKTVSKAMETANVLPIDDVQQEALIQSRKLVNILLEAEKALISDKDMAADYLHWLNSVLESDGICKNLG